MATQNAWYTQVLTDERGEKHSAVTVVREVTDSNFEKVFVTELLQQISEADQSSLPVKSLRRVLHVLGTLVNMALADNRIYATTSELAEKLALSNTSVKRYMTSFEALNLITRKAHGVWLLNGDIFARCKAGDRKNLVIQYRAVKEARQEDPRQMSIDDVIAAADVVPIPTGVMPGVAAHA